MLSDLRPQLLARLDHFAVPPGLTGEHQIADRLFCYCALRRERIAAIVPPAAFLGIVLRGRKEVWCGAFSEVLTPGTAFALPKGMPIDVVNIPDDRGLYESLILQIDRLPPGVAPCAAPRRIDRVSIALTAPIIEAIGHTAAALETTRSASIAKLRLGELLTLLSDDPAGRLLLAGDAAERARWLIDDQPDRDWRVEDLAQALGMGASSLRRELGRLGRPFRALLAEARMDAARRVLDEGGGAAAAMSAAGYHSRSHFTRAFRHAFGTTPGARRGL